MPLFNLRDAIQFAQGTNSSDTVIQGYHFNLATLRHWNYTQYDNNTLSNGTSCYITAVPFNITLLSNGTFINATSCYDPYYGIRQRGSLGIVFACLFAASMMFTLANLRKHGRLFLPNEKRFHAVGRRWQWYWMLFVAACGIISSISAIDVDRDYLQSTAIILQNFFYYLMIPGILATVWEGVRHWGSWQERQIYDYDPFSLPQDDVRGKKEFYMPLVFYLFAWLNFFMNIPRTWTGIEEQSSPQLEDDIAAPSGTDPRFKAGGIFAFLAWCVIIYCLLHSIHYYKPRNRGPFWSTVGFFRHVPKRFLLSVPLLLVIVGYTNASAWVWTVNPQNDNVSVGWMYGLGYAPIILIFAVNELAGLMTDNEDRALIKQRAARGRDVDAELGLASKKPGWWTKASGDHHLDTGARLRAMVGEIGGGQATNDGVERGIELGVLGRELDERERERADEREAKQAPRQNPFRDEEEIGREDEGRPGLGGRLDSSAAASVLSGSTAITSGSASRGPQQVRSMLDV